MTKLKVKWLKWKRLKVRGLVLHFCQKKTFIFFFSHFLSRWTLSRFLILYLFVSQCLGTRPHCRRWPPPTTSLPSNSKSWEIFHLSFFVMLISTWTAFHFSRTRFSSSISEMGLLCFCLVWEFGVLLQCRFGDIGRRIRLLQIWHSRRWRVLLRVQRRHRFGGGERSDIWLRGLWLWGCGRGYETLGFRFW